VKARIEAEQRQIGQANALEEAQARAARAALAAAELAERERSVAQQRAAVEQRIKGKTHTRQQAEERRASAVLQKLEIERTLAASLAHRKQIQSDAAESSAQRATASAQWRRMRNSLYVKALARFMPPARSVPTLLLIAAFAFGIGVGAAVRNPASPEQSALQASARNPETDKARRPSVRTLTMDDDLSAFSARVSENQRDR